MTMPTQMNCSHQGSGWCLDCVEKLQQKISKQDELLARMKSNYKIFMVDPPWDQKKGGLRSTRPNQSMALDYKTMPIEDIEPLLRSIFSRGAEHHCVFMWTTEKFLIPTESMMERLGYKRHIRLIWDKKNGIAPAFTIRFSHEYCIWFYKTMLPKIASSSRGTFRSVFSEAARQHSRKPDCLYSMIEALYPDTKKIDVFSRERRIGWDQFGDQPKHF